MLSRVLFLSFIVLGLGTLTACNSDQIAAQLQAEIQTVNNRMDSLEAVQAQKYRPEEFKAVNTQYTELLALQKNRRYKQAKDKLPAFYSSADTLIAASTAARDLEKKHIVEETLADFNLSDNDDTAKVDQENYYKVKSGDSL